MFQPYRQPPESELVGADVRESPPAKPESPRLVTRIDESLTRSLGPAPSASQHTPQIPEPFDPNSIHFTIQQHILDITNNGQMLRDILLEIARACPEPVEGAEDDPEASPEHEPALSKSKGRRITPYHRRRAVILLLDRALGSDPNAVRNGRLPRLPSKVDNPHLDSPGHPEPSPVVGQVEDLRSDEERWASIEATLNRMEEEGILTPDPNAPAIDIPMHRMPKDFDSTPFEKEEAAAFWAEIDLRIERQKQWPEIEERRRKKLAQIYPSHSEDDEDKAHTIHRMSTDTKTLSKPVVSDLVLRVASHLRTSPEIAEGRRTPCHKP